MYHTIILVGNVGRDPEMRFLPSGQQVTSFSVATNRQYRGQNGESVKETVWFRVSVFGNQAESCNKYLQKGSKVLVEGRLQADKNGGPRVWSGQDGQARASFEVVATNVRFLSSRNESEGGMGGEGMGGDFGDSGVDEIPF